MPSIHRSILPRAGVLVGLLLLLTACDLGFGPAATPTAPPAPATATTVAQLPPTDVPPTEVLPTVAPPTAEVPTAEAPTALPPATIALPPTVSPGAGTPTASTAARTATPGPAPTLPAATATASTAATDPAQRTEQVLDTTLIPGRDLYDLTRRLKLKTTEPLTATVRIRAAQPQGGRSG